MDQQALKILIIDDEIETTKILKRLLERRGYSVLTAQDGIQGLELMKRNSVQVVFCDIIMPHMDGIEFLEKIREYNLQAEVIMVTGCSSVERCVEAIERNALQYLIKPVGIETIENSLQKAKERIHEKKMMLKNAVAKDSEHRRSAFRNAL